MAREGAWVMNEKFLGVNENFSRENENSRGKNGNFIHQSNGCLKFRTTQIPPYTEIATCVIMVTIKIIRNTKEFLGVR